MRHKASNKSARLMELGQGLTGIRSLLCVNRCVLIRACALVRLNMVCENVFHYNVSIRIFMASERCTIIA